MYMVLGEQPKDVSFKELSADAARASRLLLLLLFLSSNIRRGKVFCDVVEEYLPRHASP